MSPALHRQVLIATLGTQPQIVTLAVDLLDRDVGEKVGEVYVIHTAAEGPVGEALDRLRAEFEHNIYSFAHRRCIFNAVPIVTLEGRAVSDIRSEPDARAAFQTIYRVVKQQKQAGRVIHLSIAGGRNSMVAYAVVTAQILFGPDDRLWHVISTGHFERLCREEGRMHRRSRTDAVLTLIPILYWSGVTPPVMAALAREDDPFRAIEAQREWGERQADVLRREFLMDKLTPALRRVVFDYVVHGGADRDIADRWRLSVRTISDQMGEVYARMRDFFDYDEAAGVGRETVMQQFAGFLERNSDLMTSPEGK